MLKTNLILFFSMLSVNSTRAKEIFDLTADDIVASEIGDIYKARLLLNSITLAPKTMKDPTQDKVFRKSYFKPESQNDTYIPPNNVSATTEKIILATVPPDATYPNISQKVLKERHLMRQVEKILDINYRPLLDFKSNQHDPDIITKKFDELVKKRNLSEHNTRREIYREDDNQPRRWQQKLRTLNLMEHFVYSARYKLAFVQVLRNKYFDNFRYKIGFCFALLRHLKNVQKWVYSTLRAWEIRMTGNVMHHLKLFEKITHLDVDIKDVMKVIRKLEYQKNMQYNPKFYDYSMETYDKVDDY